MCKFQSTLPRGERPVKGQSGFAVFLFQSTLPRGERPPWHLTLAWRPTPFQSTLPRGERQDGKDPVPRLRDFNPRSRVGSDDQSPAFEPHPVYISIHAPAWGATPPDTGPTCGCVFQSTLPRGERRVHHHPDGTTGVHISIHAPAWGATGGAAGGCGKLSISIHAPAWGATSWLFTGTDFGTHFNPRSRVGSDRDIVQELTSGFKISIHAPAWGATTTARKSSPPSRNFNPRSRVGSDDRNHHRPAEFGRFQSTLPRGERPPKERFPPRPGNFNPRSRVGSDLIAGLTDAAACGFQSTLPRGERQNNLESKTY